MERFRRPGLALFVVAIMASVATACSGFSLFGGIASGVLTIAAVVFWFATAATQTGCEVQTCLSLVLPEPDGGDASASDAGDSSVGPCLSIDGGIVGPCLSQPPPDGGDSGTDGGVDTGIIGPCLSQPPPDGGDDLDGSVEVGAVERNTPASSRLAAIDRLRAKGVLPADVAARLKGSKNEEA
jgi:hypothetical protein